MTSDFPTAVARVSEGFCPMCGHELARYGGSEPNHCDRCGVSFYLEHVDGRPALRPSRELREDEIRRLYARESDDSLAARYDGGDEPSTDWEK